MNDMLDKTESLVNKETLVNIVKPRVVVISRCESILEHAVESLTANNDREWMILRASESQDLADLVQNVEETNPNIVIIPQNKRGYDERLSTRLMQDCPKLKKVILVSLSENLLEVYCKQKIQVNSVEDLFSEVETQFSKL